MKYLLKNLSYTMFIKSLIMNYKKMYFFGNDNSNNNIIKKINNILILDIKITKKSNYLYNKIIIENNILLKVNKVK